MNATVPLARAMQPSYARAALHLALGLDVKRIHIGAL